MPKFALNCITYRQSVRPPYPMNQNMTKGELVSKLHLRSLDEIYDEQCELVQRFADQHKPKWISVKERLPDSNDMVLICDKFGVGLAWFERHRGKNLYWNSDTGIIKNVTHWMPLPEPPKEPEK